MLCFALMYSILHPPDVVAIASCTRSVYTVGSASYSGVQNLPQLLLMLCRCRCDSSNSFFGTSNSFCWDSCWLIYFFLAGSFCLSRSNIHLEVLVSCTISSSCDEFEHFFSRRVLQKCPTRTFGHGVREWWPESDVGASGFVLLMVSFRTEWFHNKSAS